MRLTTLFIFIILVNVAHAQYWIRQAPGATNNMAYAIATDNNGNTYSTGYFSNTIAFDNISLISTGIIDMFIVKTDPSGNILWAKSCGGNNITQGLSISVKNN